MSLTRIGDRFFRLPVPIHCRREGTGFVNTADWIDSGPDLDRMAARERLVKRELEAGVLNPGVAERFVRMAAERPVDAQQALDGGHALGAPPPAVHPCLTTGADVAGRGVVE
jgi:hypothetical protein